MRLPVVYTVFWSCGEITMGAVHAKRYLRSIAPMAREASGQGSTSFAWPVLWSYRVNWVLPLCAL